MFQKKKGWNSNGTQKLMSAIFKFMNRNVLCGHMEALAIYQT